MAASFEYGDYHKFTVSVGVVISAFAFGVPIFVMKSQSALVLSDKKYSELTPLGRDGVHRQQEQISWLISWWPLISGVTLALGLALILLGLASWRTRQGVLDDLDRAELKKRTAEGDKAAEEMRQLLRSTQGDRQELAQEIENRSREALAEEIASNPEILNVLGSTQSGHAPDQETIERLRKMDTSLVGQFNRAELATSDALERIFTDDYQGEVFRDLRFPHSTVDIAIAPGGPVERGIMVDVKLLTGGMKNYRNRFDESLSWAVRATADMRHLVKVGFEAVVAFIVPDGEQELPASKVDELAARLRSDLVALAEQVTNLRFVIATPKTLSQSSPERIERVFLKGGPVEVL
jgi:hypothetical protein